MASNETTASGRNTNLMPNDVISDMGRAAGGTSEVINDKDKFQVNMDVSQFKPEEITVGLIIVFFKRKVTI